MFTNTSGQMDINTMSLNNGVYILRAYTKNNVITKTRVYTETFKVHKSTLSFKDGKAFIICQYFSEPSGLGGSSEIGNL